MTKNVGTFKGIVPVTEAIDIIKVCTVIGHIFRLFHS